MCIYLYGVMIFFTFQVSVAWRVVGVIKNGRLRWRRAESELSLKDSNWIDFVLEYRT